MSIVITIPGTPVGKGRPRAFVRGGRVAMHTPENTASFENLVALAAQKAMTGRKPIESAVEVEIYLYVTPPESWSAKKKAQALAGIIKPTSKPDADNVIKALFDACNEVVWKDDKQVTDIARMSKRYAQQAQSVMIVREAA